MRPVFHGESDLWTRAVPHDGRDIAVECGGVAVRSGDIVFGDADGVVVIPRAETAVIAQAGKKHRAKIAPAWNCGRTAAGPGLKCRVL
jgi:regulator of RNase E activity RraA